MTLPYSGNIGRQYTLIGCCQPRNINSTSCEFVVQNYYKGGALN